MIGIVCVRLRYATVEILALDPKAQFTQSRVQGHFSSGVPFRIFNTLKTLRGSRCDDYVVWYPDYPTMQERREQSEMSRHVDYLRKR